MPSLSDPSLPCQAEPDRADPRLDMPAERCLAVTRLATLRPA